ncbi:hypothetical protein [Bacillus sp. Bva_UNVM-123]|uniref:hypothetical protein n=1 Tax=Bacillus sp. Bva_UNVM-123 TaxID=2829798 RepID=UPI00391F67C3
MKNNRVFQLGPDPISLKLQFKELARMITEWVGPESFQFSTSFIDYDYHFNDY